MWHDPWREMKRFNRRFGNLFGEDEFDDDNYRKAWTDFREEENEFVIAVELPGMEKEDIDLEIKGNAIAIRAQKKKQQKKEDKEKGIYNYSASYSGFSRMIQLPENADLEKIDAECRNGVLKIRIGKKTNEKKGKFVRIR